MVLGPLQFGFLKAVPKEERLRLVTQALFLSEWTYDGNGTLLIMMTCSIPSIFTTPIAAESCAELLSPIEDPGARFVVGTVSVVSFYIIAVNIVVSAIVWSKWRAYGSRLSTTTPTDKNAPDRTP